MIFPPKETIQALLDEARHLDSKPPETHDMRCVLKQLRGCGYASCMVGDLILNGFFAKGDVWNNLKRGGIDASYASWLPEYYASKLGIPTMEFHWLFGIEFDAWLVELSGRRCEEYQYTREVRGSRDREAPQESAKRLRKYLYYKMHRKELFGDPETKEGREQYERLRRTGDVGVVPAVLETVSG